MTDDDSAGLRIVPSGAALGAEIGGMNLGRVDDAAFARIMDAWHRHLVLLFRDQDFSDAAFLDFSARLGTLDLAPITVSGKPHRPDLPHLSMISNVVENGQPIGGLENSELIWHTDMSYAVAPPKASVLNALEVPDQGGDTSFCNMYAAYEKLPAALKERIARLTCKHDASHNSAGQARGGFADGFARREDIPGAVHPLVCRHPATARTVLYLGRRENAYIPELAEAESETLLDEIWSYVTTPENTWRHQWRVGDVLMWDNRATMHRREDFDAATRRIMHRSQIQGEAMQPAR